MSEKYIVIINDINDIKDILYIYPIKLINEDLIVKILKNKINDKFIYYNILEKKQKNYKIKKLGEIIDYAYSNKDSNNDTILMIIYKNIIIDNSSEKEYIKEYYNNSLKIELIINILNYYIDKKLKKKGNLQINSSAGNVSGDLRDARDTAASASSASSVMLQKISRREISGREISGREIGRKR